MNALEKTTDSLEWERLGQILPRPKAIVCVSAHWYTSGSRVLSSPQPRTIHDFYGFPPQLYRMEYPAPGNPPLARQIADLLGDQAVEDTQWGLDHGTWSVLVHLFPLHDVPTIQLSIDAKASAQDLYTLGTRLRPLRDQGVLILGSGNIVHDLQKVDFSMEGGFDWAYDFDAYIKNHILQGDSKAVIDYQQAGSCAHEAFHTREHFDPLLYALGAAIPGEAVSVFNEHCLMGSLSMTSYRFG